MSAEVGDDAADEIVGRCREMLERGEPVDVDAWVREHPALEEVLRRRLSVLALLHRRSGLDSDAPSAGRPAASGAATGTASVDLDARAPLRRMDPDRYVRFSAAGEGGMGVVYSAVDTELQRVVAFKMIRPDSVEGRSAAPSTTPLDLRLPPPTDPLASSAFEERKDRFLQEAWITGGLEHPGVVPLYEIGETPGGIPFYTMRFVRGLRTLADAIAEVRDRPIDDRLALVEPCLRLCDTLAYAHSMSVVHRDVKPANVALGNYGEVVLLDWGLAKLEGGEDPAAGRWQARVREFRQAADLRTVTAALGTPGYMSPEAATGRLGDVDARSDVYSLGTILFEILTGRLPFEFSTYAELVSKLCSQDAPRARGVDPAVPQALDDLVARCLSRERDSRPRDVARVAHGIRSWLAASALEREVAGHVRDARVALTDAESATGADRLRHADRAAAAIEQATARDPARSEARSLAATLASLRERGMQERDRASRRRILVRGGIGVLAAAALVAVLTARAIDDKRVEAESARADAVVARGAAETAREKAQAALVEVLRLSDSKRVRDLLVEADRLWPALPERVPAMEEWLERARHAVLNRSMHADLLDRLRKRGLPWVDEAKRKERADATARLAAIATRIDALAAERASAAGDHAGSRRSLARKSDRRTRRRARGASCQDRRVPHVLLRVAR